MRIRVILFMVLKAMKNFHKRNRDLLYSLHQNITVKGTEMTLKQEKCSLVTGRNSACWCVKLQEWVTEGYVVFLLPGEFQRRANNPTLYGSQVGEARHSLKLFTTL